MTSRILLVCGLVAAAIVCAPNPATAGPDRVDAARQIAEHKWGPACEGNVTVQRGDVPRGALAYASWRHPAGAAADPGRYFDCRITFRRGHIPWAQFCVAFVHEHLHLRGWRPSPGQEYVRPDGTIDEQHSSNPRSIMYPRYVGQRYPPCQQRPGPTAPAAAAPAAGPTVLLLPGGGWQHAYEQSMDPWVQDFRAHGIRARALSYPLRDVPAAIEHVRQVAAREPGPVIAYGISAGGTIAAALAATGDVAGAVNVIGPTDFTRWPTGLVFMREIDMTTYEQQRAASPYWRLAGRQTPQLVQCGALDPLVPCDQGTTYVRAARRAQPDTRLRVMANAHSQAPHDRDLAREWIAARWPSTP